MKFFVTAVLICCVTAIFSKASEPSDDDVDNLKFNTTQIELENAQDTSSESSELEPLPKRLPEEDPSALEKKKPIKSGETEKKPASEPNSGTADALSTSMAWIYFSVFATGYVLLPL